jgi:hypothetical protein
VDPFTELVRRIDRMARDQTDRRLTWVPAMLGTITGGGLKLDNFKHEIKDYLVSHHLALAEPDMTSTETDGEHSGHTVQQNLGKHSHQVITPNPIKPLPAGDRVLVMPVANGQIFVVVARVVPHA